MPEKEDASAPPEKKGQSAVARWTGHLLLLGAGLGAGYWWGTTVHHPLANAQGPVLSALAQMDKKLDLIWAQGSTLVQASQGPGQGALLELPPIPLNGGVVKFRFKRIDDRYHYEASLEGGVEAISRLVAPQGKSSLLKATFVDADRFDLTDLTLPGGQFLIQQPDGGKGVALTKQGLWESPVDPATIKGWRLEVLEGSVEATAAASPSPSAQVQQLAADITVQPTGRWVLPESLQNVQQSATPTPPAATPVFQPPAAMPTPTPAPNGGGLAPGPVEAKGKS